MTKPRFCIIKTDGTNCDVETAHAVSLAGGAPETIHVNRLRSGEVKLVDFQGLILAGGFSYGDDIASGKILANELVTLPGDPVGELVRAHKPVLGICNGFQILVRMGLLPFPDTGQMHATLAHNDSGHFQCQWVDLVPTLTKDTPCVFIRGIEQQFPLQMANGEGRYKASQQTLERMQSGGLIVLRYAKNPNGSLDSIAGVCSPNGRIFGLMPHPERLVDEKTHPNWRRESIKPYGLMIFQNMVRAAMEV